MPTNLHALVSKKSTSFVRTTLFLLAFVLAIAPCKSQTIAAAADKYPSDTRPVQATNEFASLNPGYKQRAGLSYEKEYLPTAVDQLAKCVNLEPPQKKITTQILRSFIYDFLTVKVRDNGQVTPDHLKAAITAMDEKFANELSKEQFDAYTQWRDDIGGGNALGFLMHGSGRAQ